MDTQVLESAVSSITRKARISAYFTVVFGLAVAASLFLYVKKIGALSREVTTLESQIAARNSELLAHQERLSAILSALGAIQEGTQHLLNRQYPEAIQKYKQYLEVQPGSSEALNFLGYAELRYAAFWRARASSDELDGAELLEAKNQASHYYAEAEAHLTRASEVRGASIWATYNLSILYYQADRKTDAMRQLERMLAQHPSAANWICDDGQFRRFALDREIGSDFRRLVNDAARSQDRQVCWVTQPRRE